MTEWQNRIIGEGEENPEQLLANPANFRIHPKQQQDVLTDVLDEVGWVQRVIVNRTTGHMVDGHLRAQLAISRGEPAIPVTYVELTLDEERKILATLDPLAAMAATDEEKRQELLAQVNAEGAALSAWLAEMIEPPSLRGDPDEVPELPTKPTTKVGDLLTLGEHRLVCGDSSDTDVLDRLLDGIRATCLLTDPPYGIGLDTDYSQLKGSRKSMLKRTTYPSSDETKRAARAGQKVVTGRLYREVEGDDGPFDATFYAERFRAVKEQYWFGANYYRQTLLPNEDLAGSWLVWDKRPGAMVEGSQGLDEVFGSHFELIWSRQSHQQRMIRKQWSGFTARNQGMERAHPTEKPVDVLLDIIERATKRGAVVVDPFAGVGTALVACEQSMRRAAVVEIDPAYCDVIVARWEGLTGKKAKRSRT